MNWQEWIVGILIVLCIARFFYSIFLFFRRVQEKDNTCKSCISGCELKNQLDRKKQACKQNTPCEKKKCCR